MQPSGDPARYGYSADIQMPGSSIYKYRRGKKIQPSVHWQIRAHRRLSQKLGESLKSLLFVYTAKDTKRAMHSVDISHGTTFVIGRP